jgi:hypothetical protein
MLSFHRTTPAERATVEDQPEEVIICAIVIFIF